MTQGSYLLCASACMHVEVSAHRRPLEERVRFPMVSMRCADTASGSMYEL